MLQKERHRYILEKIASEKRVHSDVLSRDLSVSTDTVRRDLIELEKAGSLVRVHGGAVATDFHNPFLPSEVYARKEKIQIARKALSLIQDGMTIVSGGGTVMLELARIFPESLNGTFFTVSPLVALEVAQRSSVEVILVAGRLSRDQYICTGASVLAQLADIKADLCLLGSNGFATREGVTDFDWEVMQVKKALIRSADKTALLSLSEKSGVSHRYRVCPMQEIDYLVTERASHDLSMEAYNGYCKVL